LLVIDNASPNDSVARLRAFDPGLAILETRENLGWGGAQNLGRRYAGFGTRAEYVLALNSDAELDPDCLGALRRALEGDPRCAVAAPLIYRDRARTKIDNVGYNLSYRYFLPLDRARWRRNHARYLASGEREVTWTDDTVALMRSDMVDEAGGYDEGYFLYVDMTDLAYRLRMRGRTFRVCYRAVAFHSGKGSSGDGLSAFSLYHKFYGWWRFQNKHFPKSHRPYVIAWMACMYIGIGLKLCLTGRGRILADLTRFWIAGQGGPRP
jgi:GT2 family glycosyltransferase